MHALIVGEAEEEEALCGSDYGFEQLLLLLLLLQLEFKSLGHDIHSFVCPWSPQQNFLGIFGQHFIFISYPWMSRKEEGWLTDSLTPYIPPHERGWICSLVVKYPLTLTALWFIMDVYVHDNLCYLVLYKWVRTISRGDIPKMHFLTWPPPSPGPCVLGMPPTLGLYPWYNKLGY